MAKTRSQTVKTQIKEETKEEERKSTLLINNVSNTTRSRSKIVKRRVSTCKIRVLPTRQVKLEEGTDSKHLLSTPQQAPTSNITPSITEQQIEQLIGYIVNDNMNLKRAASMVKMSYRSASYYYTIYQEDPEHSIPSLQKQSTTNKLVHSHEQVETLIRCLVDEKMTIFAASRRANMSGTAARTYYGKFLNDPDRKIPRPYSPFQHSPSKITQEQVNALIRYIVNDKMNVSAASMKTAMSETSAGKYYRKYLSDPNHKIPIVNRSRIPRVNSCSENQVKKLISHIVNDNMTIKEASSKVNMSRTTGFKYYQRYLRDPNQAIPVPTKHNTKYTRPYSHAQIKQLISYIVNDQMSVADASIKVGMSRFTGSKYYQQYLDDPSHEIPNPGDRRNSTLYLCTADQIRDFIGYIVNDKMSIAAASLKAGISRATGGQYYRRYLNDPNHEIPQPGEQAKTGRCCTQNQIKDVIHYIVDDKMSLKDASSKANMACTTARKFYQQYINDPKRTIPTPDGKTRSIYTHGREKVNKMVGYMVNDKMTIKEACIKANINECTGRKWYRRYLDDPNCSIPLPEEPIISRRQAQAQAKMKEMMDYVQKDKMTIADASKKANISKATGMKYYRQYVNDSKHNTRSTKHIRGEHLLCTQEQVNQVISNIVDKKMSITKASEKVKISRRTGAKYYHQYMNDPNHAIPTPQRKKRSGGVCTSEQIKKLVHYVVGDKMSVKAASKKVDLCYASGRKYYNLYLNDPNHEIPIPRIEGGYESTKLS